MKRFLFTIILLAIPVSVQAQTPLQILQTELEDLEFALLSAEINGHSLEYNLTIHTLRYNDAKTKYDGYMVDHPDPMSWMEIIDAQFVRLSRNLTLTQEDLEKASTAYWMNQQLQFYLHGAILLKQAEIFNLTQDETYLADMIEMMNMFP